MSDHIEKLTKVRDLVALGHSLRFAFMTAEIGIADPVVLLIAEAAGVADKEHPALEVARLPRPECVAAVARALRKEQEAAGVTITEPSTFVVKYYDAKLSKKGQGVQFRRFTTRDAAENFAAQNRIYAGPCTVEERKA
jgi:hypothetical protein